MATITVVPITITPDAAMRVAELGMHTELDRMLEHTRQAVPGLRSIEVQLALPYDTGDETSIVIQATMDNPHQDDDTTDTEWAKWQVRTFSAEVCRYFVMLSLYGPPTSASRRVNSSPCCWRTKPVN
jgi:hypothetical protein